MGLFDNLLDRVERKVNNAYKSAVQTAETTYASIMGNEPKKAVTKKTVKQNPSDAKTSTPKTPAQNKAHNNSIMVQESTKTDPVTNVQAAKKSQNTTIHNKTTEIKQEINNKIKRIQEKAKEAGISDEEIKNIMKNRNIIIDQKTYRQPSELNAKLSDLETAINDFAELKKNGLASDIKAASFVNEKVGNSSEARKLGFNEKKYNYNKRMRKLLGENFEQLSVEEKNQKIAMIKQTFDNEFEADYQTKYEKASKKEKVWLEANKSNLKNIVDKELQLSFSATTTDCGEYSVRFRNGHQVADAKKVAINIQKDPQKVADKMTFDYDLELLEYYNSIGQLPTAKEHGEGVQFATSKMSYKAIETYESKANEYKAAYYEGKANVPSYLTEEYLTETTAAIGMGATINENLSTEQKADFLKTWDEHAQQYRDYDEVKNTYSCSLKQYLKEHPEAKQGVEDIKTKYQEKYGTSPDTPKTTKKYDIELSENNYNLSLQLKNDIEPQKINNKTHIYKVKSSTSKDIALAIKQGNITVTDAIVLYKEKAFDAIFENENIFLKNKTIAKLHINNNRKNLQKLLELSKFSSAVELIVQNISPTIKDEYIKEVELSGITKKAIFGKDEENAAA